MCLSTTVSDCFTVRLMPQNRIVIAMYKERSESECAYCKASGKGKAKGMRDKDARLTPFDFVESSFKMR